jgi:hypothetical protein
MAQLNPHILGIYIGTHGKINRTDVILQTPNGVSIVKQNLAGLCAVAYGTFRTRVQNGLLLAHSLLDGFDMAKTEEGYLEIHNKKASSCLDMKGSCTRFTNPSGWLQKRYYTKNKPSECSFVIAYMDKVIDLIHCTPEELDQFCEGLDIKDMLEAIHDLILVPETDMNESKFNTSTLFTIIELFRDTCGVNDVRILDETCNASSRELQGDFALPDKVGFGGKRRRTRRVKKSPRLEHIF